MIKREKSSFGRREFSLRKLPMWGTKVKKDKINFDWPKKELLEQMPEGVYLKSLEFKAQSNGVLISVRCNLSNDLSSPKFEK